MKSLHQYLLILAISALPFLPLFATVDMPHTHDGPVHLARMAAYYKALTGGQILPRWAADLNYGYGMPLFNFIYHTPYLVSFLFLGLGFGLVATFKLVLALSYLLAGLGMYLFAKEFFKNDKTALLVTVFYQFAPFRLVESHVRGSLGEVFTYTALPFLLWGLVRLAHKPTIANAPLSAIAGAILIFSHNSVSLLFFAVAVAFALTITKTWSARFWSGIALVWALGLSATYWAPAVLERKFTYGDLFMKEIFQNHFPPWQFLLVPNITNQPSLLVEGISVQIGIFHLLALVAAMGQARRLAYFIFGLSLLSLFFMLPISWNLWATLPLLRQFQFPWRFLSVFVITTALASTFLQRLRILKKSAVWWAVVFLLIATTMYYWRPPLGFDRIADERYFWNYPLNTTFYGETDVIWSAGRAYAYPQRSIDVFSGDAIVSNLKKRPTTHTFTVTATKPSNIVDNTTYFPGWRVYVDGMAVPVQFQDANWRGLVTFAVTPGTHAVRVAFERTPVRLVSDAISVLSVFAVAWLIIWQKKNLLFQQ